MKEKNDGENTPLSCRCVLITISNSSGSTTTTTPPNRQKSIMKVLMQFSAFSPSLSICKDKVVMVVVVSLTFSL